MALLEVGRVVKPHGLRGEVVVKFVSNRDERLARGAQFFLGEDADAAVLSVESIRPQGRQYLVRFAGVESLEAAEQLRGETLYGEPIEDEDALFVHELIGAEVFDQAGGRKGVVTSVEANPASDLLVVDGRYFVPLRFVVDHEPGRLVVEAPEGIFE